MGETCRFNVYIILHDARLEECGKLFDVASIFNDALGVFGYLPTSALCDRSTCLCFE